MRLRELGLTVGDLPTGETNAITDVAGVLVGQQEWITDAPSVQRTGVTVIIPRDDVYHHPVYAGTDVLNGFGEMTGRANVDEWGLLSTPIVLTNTRSVGQGYEAIVQDFLQHPARRPEDELPLPVVGECDDSYLNDFRFATPESIFADAFRAVQSGPVAEGARGAGAGMQLFGYKGGIGTASRRIRLGDREYTVGVLVNTNFGRPYQMRAPEGLERVRAQADVLRDGSCVGVAATDVPLWPHELKRIAKRMGLGLGRTGSVANDTSGELFLAFSTARPEDYARLAGSKGMLTGQDPELDDGSPISRVFDAVIEATEEAVWNALLAAPTVRGVDGHVLEGFRG